MHRLVAGRDGHVQIAISDVPEDEHAQARHRRRERPADGLEIARHLGNRHADIEVVSGAEAPRLKDVLTRSPHRAPFGFRLGDHGIDDGALLHRIRQRALEPLVVRLLIAAQSLDQRVHTIPMSQQRSIRGRGQRRQLIVIGPHGFEGAQLSSEP